MKKIEDKRRKDETSEDKERKTKRGQENRRKEKKETSYTSPRTTKYTQQEASPWYRNKPSVANTNVVNQTINS